MAFRAEGEVQINWERGVKDVLAQPGMRSGDARPEGFDPPPLGGATRASVVARVPQLSDRATITALYARSILAIAQHHKRPQGRELAGRADAIELDPLGSSVVFS